MVRKDGHSGDAGIFAGKALKGVLCGRTIIAVDTVKGRRAMDQLMETVADKQWDVLLPAGSGLTKLESCWIKANTDRLRSLISNPTTRGFAVSGPRTPAASKFRSSFARESALSRPHALDDQNHLLSPPPIQKLPKVLGLLLPRQPSLHEPCGQGVSWDLKVAAFSRQSTVIARMGRYLHAKQVLALPVMLCSSLLFSAQRRQ
jgi:hypothetical protein